MASALYPTSLQWDILEIAVNKYRIELINGMQNEFTKARLRATDDLLNDIIRHGR